MSEEVSAATMGTAEEGVAVTTPKSSTVPLDVGTSAEQSPQRTLSSDDVVEIHRFSQGKFRIEELTKTLESRPEIDLLGNVQSASGLTEADVETLASSTAEKQAELHKWREERDSIEASMAEYNMEDMEKLRKLSAAASRRHMSRQDTDLVEVALQTLVAFDALLSILSTRRIALDIYGQRLSWDAARMQGWQAYLQLASRVADFVQQRGRWSIAIYEIPIPAAVTTDDGTPPSTSPTTSTSGRSRNGRPSRYAMREKLELEVSRLRSRADELAAGAVLRSGQLLDELIELCKVPEELLDEQERLEDAVAALAPRIEFCSALFGQWKRADDAWFALQATRTEAQSLHSAVKEAMEREMEEEAVSSCTSRDESLVAKLATAIKRDPSRLLSSTASSTPIDVAKRILRAPACAAFPDQAQHNAMLEQCIAEEIGQALAEVKESHAAVERQRKAWIAHQSLVQGLAELRKLTEKHSTTTRILRQGWRAGDAEELELSSAVALGSEQQEAPTELNAVESLETDRHASFLARLPMLSDDHAERCQATTVALQAAQRAVLSCTANSTLTSVGGIPAQQIVSEAEEVMRQAQREMSQAQAKAKALQDARAAHQALDTARKSAQAVKARLLQACANEAWRDSRDEAVDATTSDLLSLTSEVSTSKELKASALSSSTLARRGIAEGQSLPDSDIVRSLSTEEAELVVEMETVPPLLAWANVLHTQRLDTDHALHAALRSYGQGEGLANKLRELSTRPISAAEGAETIDSLHRSASHRKEALDELRSTHTSWKSDCKEALDGLASRVPLVGPVPDALSTMRDLEASPDDVVRGTVNTRSAELSSLLDELETLKQKACARVAEQMDVLAELEEQVRIARDAAAELVEDGEALRALVGHSDSRLQELLSSAQAPEGEGQRMRRFEEDVTERIGPALTSLRTKGEHLTKVVERLNSHVLVSEASVSVDRHDAALERARQVGEEAQELMDRLREEVDLAEKREAEALRRMKEQEEEAHKVAQAEADRITEEERLRHEAEMEAEAERLGQEAEEQDRLRQEAEEEERLRQEAKAKERLRQEAEEEERLRQEAAEAEARLRQEAEAAETAKRLEEEEARLERAREDAARAQAVEVPSDAAKGKGDGEVLESVEHEGPQKRTVLALDQQRSSTGQVDGTQGSTTSPSSSDEARSAIISLDAITAFAAPSDVNAAQAEQAIINSASRQSEEDPASSTDGATLPEDTLATPQVIITATSRGLADGRNTNDVVPPSSLSPAAATSTDVFGPVATQPKSQKGPNPPQRAPDASLITRMHRLAERLQDDVVERQTIGDGLAQMRAFLDLPTPAEAAEVEQEWTAIQGEGQKLLATTPAPPVNETVALRDVLSRRAAKVRRFVQLARFSQAATRFEMQLSAEIEAIDAAAGSLDQESARLTSAAEEANAAADPVAQDARVRARITQLNRSRQDVEAMAREAMGGEPVLPSTPSSYAASLASSEDGYSDGHRTDGAATPALSDHSEAASVSSASADRSVSVPANLPPLVTPRKQRQMPAAAPSSQSRRSVSEGNGSGIPSLLTPRATPRSVTPSAIPRSPRTPRVSTMAPPLQTPTLLTPGQRRLPSVLRSPSGSKLPLRSSSSRSEREQSKRPNRYRANPKSKLDVAVGKIVNHLPVPVEIVHASSAAAPDGRGKSDGWQDESGRYWVGHPEPKLCFCRILRSRTVMVRIGGGWQELSNYVLRHYADLASQMAIGTGNSPKHTPPRQADPDTLPWISSATLTTPRSRQVSLETSRPAPAGSSARKRVESLRGTRDTSSSSLGPRRRKGSTPSAVPSSSSLRVPPLPATPSLGSTARRRPSFGPDLIGTQSPAQLQDQMIPVFFRRQHDSDSLGVGAGAGGGQVGRRSFSGAAASPRPPRHGRASTSSQHG